MEALAITYCILSVFAAGLLYWFHSPKGSEWTKHLDD